MLAQVVLLAAVNCCLVVDYLDKDYLDKDFLQVHSEEPREEVDYHLDQVEDFAFDFVC
tara:strand:- start:107 stop:280 length:174 start_codon:yes stop_codon:yes gene_type:complete